MVRNISIFFGLGLLWLFLFALPIGKGKTLHGILHYYLVDTRPVHWVVGKVVGSYDATLEATDDVGEAASTAGNERLSQGESMLKSIE